MSARDEILANVRNAVRDVTDPNPETDSPVAWKYGQPVEIGDVLEVFIDRVVDYKATVVRSPAADVPAAIVKGAADIGIDSVVVPPGLDPKWVEALEGSGVRVVVDDMDHQLSNEELNELGGVVTAAAVGAAQTGTIMLNHTEDQGRRALTLVPDAHICVIRADQVVSGVPEAVAVLKPAVLSGRPLTWISGGSATSDIELSRVEGVHGPRTLYVIVSE